MCTISDQLKLCTCKTKNVKQLMHYWVLKRQTKTDIITSMVGEIMLPLDIGEAADKFNKKTIVNLLNQTNCFDTEITHQDDDMLELHFTIKTYSNNPHMFQSQGGYLVYTFKFKKGKWFKEQYDPFQDNYTEIEKGKIQNPFRHQEAKK